MVPANLMKGSTETSVLLLRIRSLIGMYGLGEAQPDGTATSSCNCGRYDRCIAQERLN